MFTILLPLGWEIGSEKGIYIKKNNNIYATADNSDQNVE